MFLFSHSWKEVRVKQRNTVNEGINIVLGFHFVCFFCRLESQLWRSFRSRSRIAATDQKSAACVPSGRGGFVFLPVFSLLTSVKTSSLPEKLIVLRRSWDASPPEGFSRHQLVDIRVKTSSGLSSTRGALHDVFASNIRLLSLLDRAGQGDGAVAYLGGFPWMAA